MTWNWLAWNKAYHMPAVVPKAFSTLRPNATSEKALHKPSTALTIKTLAA